MTRRMIVRACLTTAAIAACLGIITSVEVSTAPGGGLLKALSIPLKSFRVGKGLPDLPRLMERRTVRSAANAPIMEASIWTDKGDYYPGETVLVSGSGWQGGDSNGEDVLLNFHE